MIILLYGQDSYRLREKLNEIISRYQTAAKGFSLRQLEAEELSLIELENELKKRSMFKEKKLVIIKNLFSSGLAKRLGDLTEAMLKSDDIFLFWEPGDISAKEPLFALLKKQAKTEEFAPLGEIGLRNWIKKEFSRYGVKISETAIIKLIAFVGNDLWRCANEIKKLVSHQQGGTVEAKEVELLVKPLIETKIFATIDAIAVKDKRRAFRLIAEHLEAGESPLYLLAMINFQFRNLLVIKDLLEKRQPYYSLAKLTGLHPFVIKKSSLQAEKFSLDELKKIYQKIFQVDNDIKRGRIEPQAALDFLVAEICSLRLCPTRK